jgi:hypothetical protein
MASVGVQINKHYSNGKLYSIATFTEPKSCCDAYESSDMHHNSLNQSNQEGHRDCSCKDEKEVLRIQNIFISEKFSMPGVSSNDLFVIAGFEDIYWNILSYNPNTTFYSRQPVFTPDLLTGYCLLLC